MRKCSKSWIETYLDYTEKQESPLAFHQWTSLCVLSTCLGRNIQIPRVQYVTYPNIYVILVAGSARCRKSSAIRIGKRLIADLEHPPMMFAQKMTVEALIAALGEEGKKCGYCTGFLVSDELSVFLGSDAAKTGVVPALTDMYDNPKLWTYQTRGRGKEELRNVTITMLAATTKKDIGRCMPKDAIGGGFTSRVVFVYQEVQRGSHLFGEKDKNGYEMVETPRQRVLRAELLHDLEHMVTLKGKIKFTEKAQDTAEEWYEIEQTIKRDENVDGYYGRKHDTMFKLATLLSVSRCDDLIIDVCDVKEALRILGDNEDNMESIIASVMTSDIGNAIERVLTVIKRSGKISHSDLISKTWRMGNSKEITDLVRTLIEGGEIEETFTDGSNRGRAYKVRRKRR